MAQNSNYRAIAKQVGYDVYEVLGGAEFKLYKEGLDEHGTTVRTVVAEGLQSDAEGVIHIAGFSWDETGIYYLEETKTKDDTWLLPNEPMKIDMTSVVRNNPDGIATVFMENQPKRGEILVSKYDRYSGGRLAGIEFTLYKGTTTDTVYATKVTDQFGYIRFRDLPLGNYILKETKTLDGYVLDETLHAVSVTPDNRYFYYHIYNMQEGERLDIPVKKVWLGTEPIYAAGEGLVVELYEGTKTDPIETAVLTKANGWAHVFEDLLKRDAQGRAYTYILKEKDTTVPSGYKVAVAQGSIDASEYPLTVTVAEEVVLKNHALGDLSVTKTWQDCYDALRPESVELTLKRAAYNSDAGQYGEYITYKGPVSVNANTDTPWSYTWKDLETHDVNGKAYKYKVTEGDVTGYTLVGHAPEHAELSGGLESTITLTNRQLLTQKASKAWSANSPTVKPAVVFQLVRKTDAMADYEVVAGEEPKLIPSGSDSVEWTMLPATDGDGYAYSYSVLEGYLNTANEFVAQVPENYKAETTFESLYDQANNEIGTEVIVTNTWQETSFTATKSWSDNAPSVKPDVQLVLRQNGELYKVDGQPKTLQDGETEAKWSNLPVYYLADKDNDGILEEYEHQYSVDELDVPESYTKELVSATEVKNVYHSVSLEAEKYYDLTNVMDDFIGVDVRPASITFSLYKGILNEATGVTSWEKFDEVVLDGVVDDNITDAGETAEWCYTWYKLPKYSEIQDAAGNATRVENKYKIIEEIIPKNYELIGSEDVSDASTPDIFRWEVTNRYCNGFTAHKTWDIGDKTAEALGGLPSITLRLHRGIELDDGTRIDETVWSEVVGDPVILDGIADDLGLGVSRETTQEDSLTWTYTWFDLLIYGEAGPDLGDYGLSEGDRVRYFYYVTEELSEAAAQDYSLDADSSTGTSLVNRLDKTSFVAEKQWLDGPVDDRPEIEFALYSDYVNPATGERTIAEMIMRATLDGVSDENGETSPWIYEFKDLKHYVKNDDGTYLKDADDKPVPYRYFVKEGAVDPETGEFNEAPPEN